MSLRPGICLAFLTKRREIAKFLVEISKRSSDNISRAIAQTDHWCSGQTCLPVTEKITSSNLVWSAKFNPSVSVPCYHHRIGPDASLGPIAQLVEHGTENAGVGGSTPPWATNLKKKRFGAFFRWPKPCSNLPPPGIFTPHGDLGPASPPNRLVQLFGA